jgi:DNA-binding response OmpR family regulator
MHVLIVDDEIDQAWALAELLNDRGIASTVAPSGLAALGAIESARPDVAVIDLRMPKMDGVDLLVQLRERAPALPPHR